MSLKITMMAEGELAFKNHLLIEAFVLPSANPNLRRKRLGDINLHAHKCIHRMNLGLKFGDHLNNRNREFSIILESRDQARTRSSWEAKAKYIITCLGSRSPTVAGAERPQDAFRWSRMAVTEGPSIRELCNEGCIETGGSFRDFNGRKGNGWSTIESRGLFRSRISGKIGLTGALVTAGEEEESTSKNRSKGWLRSRRVSRSRWGGSQGCHARRAGQTLARIA
ncbi:hypothetical protein L2E82_15014 [Cichorium intybus]|uniref:Uncharacterized protein n=1 Tax=Cichorium intybus TaxID=13427 RepID=A0ACB9F229_CICIN|nr:hypothetical protein L2E82_15014 [Cichorium intybus]